MKSVAFLTITLLFILAAGQSQGQTQPTTKETKKEIRQEKKAKKLTLKKLAGATVNPKAKKNFEAKYGKTPRVRFARRNYFDVATYMKDDIEINVYFDNNGDFVGSTNVAKFSDIPLNGQKKLMADYKGYKVKKVVFFKDNPKNDCDMMLYDIQFDDEDTYFVEMSKGNKTIVVQVEPNGKVYYFTSI
jgi:hypothetical protein